MGKSKSNVGVDGVDSLRIDGMALDDLPMVPAAHAKEQLPEFIRTSKQSVIDSVKARYPKQSIAWVDGALREVNANIQRCRELVARTEASINEYSGLIALCRHRDKALMPLRAGQDDEEIRKLKKQFPPYNLKAMKTQVGQFKATINRCNEVIDKEHQTIAELHELRGSCQRRDDELRLLGEAV